MVGGILLRKIKKGGTGYGEDNDECKSRLARRCLKRFNYRRSIGWDLGGISTARVFFCRKKSAIMIRLIIY